MHARMTTIRTQPGKVAEAMDIARGSMTPHASEQQGFKGLLALTDPESDEVVFISLWDTDSGPGLVAVQDGLLRERVQPPVRLVAQVRYFHLSFLSSIATPRFA